MSTRDRKTAPTTPSGSGAPEPGRGPGEERVVTIGATHLALVVAVLAVLAGGFWVGRRAIAPAATAAPTAAPLDSLVPAVQDPAQAVAGSSGISNEGLSPGVIIDLGEPNHPLIGQPLIDIQGATLDGQPVKLSDFKGQPIMLNFWATWCPPCRFEMPWMEQAYQRHKDEGLVIVAVDAGERVVPEAVTATVQSFATATGLTFPILLAEDPYTPQAQYYVSSLPSSFLIDREGKIVDAHRGMYPNNVTLANRLTQMLGLSQS
jgi:thiol-disulfide isomerase/thioredoxin